MSDNSYTATQSKIQALARHLLTISQQIETMDVATYIARHSMKRVDQILEGLSEEK